MELVQLLAAPAAGQRPCCPKSNIPYVVAGPNFVILESLQGLFQVKMACSY